MKITYVLEVKLLQIQRSDRTFQASEQFPSKKTWQMHQELLKSSLHKFALK